MAFHNYGDGRYYGADGNFFWGVTTMLLMNRCHSGRFLDLSPLTQKPIRAFAFFMLGVSINTFVNVIKFQDLGYHHGEYYLDRRVA